MTPTTNQPVILCSGSGTRLWPLSRAGFPKRFLCLTGAESLIQQAAKRLGGTPYIVSNEEHRFLAQEQLREVGITTATFLLEPVGRNTAPALTLAALAASEQGNDPVLVVTPADQTIDAVLVADKTCSQDVKHIVNVLSQQQREEHNPHRKVHRPWGWYDSIDEGGRFKVKRIQVKPKASLSLQKHHHRVEHWIAVKDTAEITNGDKVLTLTENQPTYIPLGEVHRLANPGTIPLEIIEVQSGSCLGEDTLLDFQTTTEERNDKESIDYRCNRTGWRISCGISPKQRI